VTGRKLRYVDPHAPRGPLYRAIRRLSTRVGAWLSVNSARKLDPHLLELTRGRFSSVRRLSSEKRAGAASGTLADRVYSQYADFREQARKAGRVIPIVQLVPRQRLPLWPFQYRG
jgi:hypothetical protein